MRNRVVRRQAGNGPKSTRRKGAHGTPTERALVHYSPLLIEVVNLIEQARHRAAQCDLLPVIATHDGVAHAEEREERDRHGLTHEPQSRPRKLRLEPTTLRGEFR